jgi:hydrogenase nickel incorporation protein HypA/HybF
MHELDVCLELLQQVQVIAQQHGRDRVASIAVRVGPLSGVEPQLLINAWPVASAGTGAAGARLDVETSCVRIQCSSCAAESEVLPNRLLCSNCGDWRTRVLCGEELLLVSVVLERGGAAPAGERPDEQFSQQAGVHV